MDWDKIAREGIARAAMQAMCDDHQGNAIFDDGLLDTCEAQPDQILDLLRAIERCLMGLGIEPMDEEFVEFMRQAHIEIEVMKEGRDG